MSAGASRKQLSLERRLRRSPEPIAQLSYNSHQVPPLPSNLRGKVYPRLSTSKKEKFTLAPRVA